MTLTARVAIATYSVRPRGGAVHSVELAEALAAEGVDVTLIALGDPAKGFFRPTTVPVHIVEAPPRAGTLTERVFSHIEALTSGLIALADRFDIVHTQDCISARAAARVRDSRSRVPTVPYGPPHRRLHHPGADRVPGRGHHRAGPGAGGERAVEAAPDRRLRRERGGGHQRGEGRAVCRCRRGPPGERARPPVTDLGRRTPHVPDGGRHRAPQGLALSGRGSRNAQGGAGPAADAGGGGRPFLPGLPGLPGRGARVAGHPRPATGRRCGAGRHGARRGAARLVRRRRQLRVPVDQRGLGAGHP